MVAQTNIQLYNQLRAHGMSLEDMLLIRRAYEVNTTLYTGFFQADGKTFVSHGIGVASVLTEIGQPADVIAFGLLHNVYGNGDFGDHRGPGSTPKRRRLVRDAVGERVELMCERFGQSRVTDRSIDDILARVDELDEIHRILAVVDLADTVEKHADLGCLYYGDGEWVIGEVERAGAKFVKLAGALGEQELAAMLTESFERVASETERVPAELRPPDGQQYAKLVVPRSCRKRREPRYVATQVRGRLKLRRRFRAVRTAVAR
ncbi:MAG: DUF6817 domain-containing protein [Gaiellaceae bacterium]